jgi:hypothetical protein
MSEFPQCPKHKERHYWIMSAANWCKSHGLSQPEAVAKIRENLTRRPNPHNEIEKTVAKVYAEAPVEPGDTSFPPLASRLLIRRGGKRRSRKIPSPFLT